MPEDNPLEDLLSSEEETNTEEEITEEIPDIIEDINGIE